LRVEANPNTYSQGAESIARYRAQVAAKIQKMLGLRAVIEVAEPGSIPRTDFKARRVIDDREVFRDLYKKLADVSH
jgi:phenylacetate-CoA ligase